MKYTIILLFGVFVLPCKAQETNTEKDTEEIVNLILSSFDEPICLVEDTFLGHPRINPQYVIKFYFKVYNSSKESVAYSLFYEDVDGIISEKGLEELQGKNLEWEKGKWLSSEIRDSKNVIIAPNCQNQDRRRLKISEPIFTEDGKRALMLVSSSVKVLEKENDKWTIKGGYPWEPTDEFI